MIWIVGLLAIAMAVFAIGSAIREVRLYRKALKGEIQFLISRSRMVRRILISLILLTESGFLIFGFFFFHPQKPGFELLFWVPPLILIFALLFLTFRDLYETSRDVDRIFREELREAAKKNKRGDTETRR